MEGRNRIIFETEYIGVFFACKSVHELPLAAVFMRYLKAKSPGSSPGNAPKNLNTMNNLKANSESRWFVFLFWWHFGGTFADVVLRMK